MNRIRALALIAALFSGLLQAAELKVAILVQDTAQLSMQSDLLPSGTPGASTRFTARCRLSPSLEAPMRPLLLAFCVILLFGVGDGGAGAVVGG